MTKRRIAVVAAAILVVGGCANQRDDGTGGGSVPQGGGPGPITPKPTPTGKPTETKDTGYIKLQRAEDSVSCDRVDTKITFTAQEGATHWTAKAKREPGFHKPAPADGISVQPASGSLKEGQSATVRVTGAYDKTKKWFYVQIVSRNGTTGAEQEYKCR